MHVREQDGALVCESCSLHATTHRAHIVTQVQLAGRRIAGQDPQTGFVSPHDMGMTVARHLEDDAMTDQAHA